MKNSGFKDKGIEHKLKLQKAAQERAKKKKATKSKVAPKKRATAKNKPKKTKRALKMAAKKRLCEQYDIPIIPCNRWGTATTYTRSDLLRGMLWTVFSKYIRERDAELPCVSCGLHQDELHAGHYVPVGGNDIELCFNELNVNGECPTCNADFHGEHLIGMRRNLVYRYGELVVEEIENLSMKKRAIKWEEYTYVHRIKHYLDLLDGEW